MSRTTHRPIHEQVIVITGASSGIGLATALAAAREGARLVLAARSIEALQEIAEEMNANGGETVAVECDVSDRRQVERVAQTALDRFGRIDTWVNNAGAAVYGRIDEVSDEDNRRLFETNFWGVVNGSLAALPFLKESQGTLINVGSEVSEAAVPMLGIYTASKHAVKGFTDCLRIELENMDEAPITITLIQPTAVDTPFPQHARNYMANEPKLPDPLIEPSRVADAILDAAVNPKRDAKVGFKARMNTMTAKFMPGTADRMSAAQAPLLHYDEPPRHPEGALYQPSAATGVVGQIHGVGGHVSEDDDD